MIDFTMEFDGGENLNMDFSELQLETPTEHNDLASRDADNAHPVSAITGLEEALDSKLDEEALEPYRTSSAQDEIDEAMAAEIVDVKEDIHELGEAVSDLNDDVDGLETNKADKSTTYTKTEVDEKTQSVDAEAVEVVESLSASSTHAQIPSAKAVVDYAEKKSRQYELIETITIGEDVASIVRDREPDGTSYNFRAVFVACSMPAGTGVNSIRMSAAPDGEATGVFCIANANATTSSAKYGILKADIEQGLLLAESIHFNTGGNSSRYIYPAGTNGWLMGKNSITKLSFTGYDVLQTGLSISIYAVRA